MYQKQLKYLLRILLKKAILHRLKLVVSGEIVSAEVIKERNSLLRLLRSWTYFQNLLFEAAYSSPKHTDTDYTYNDVYERRFVCDRSQLIVHIYIQIHLYTHL